MHHISIYCIGTTFKGGLPYSFTNGQLSNEVDHLLLNSPEIESLKAEDLIRDKNGMFYRAGVTVPVNAGLSNAGSWTELPGGDRIWRLKISAKGARAIGVYYDMFWLPPGGRLHLYTEDQQQVIGAYTEENNDESGLFVTELTRGESVILEYFEPSRTRNHALLHISEIAYVYRGVRSLFGQLKDYGDSESCEVDVNCPEGANWQDEKKGVARIFLKVGMSYGWCSGSLLNNERQDCTPYFLTADHCGYGATSADLNQWVFYFNYEAPTCNYSGAEPGSNTITGCTLKAHGGNQGNSGSDFYLVQFNSAPSFNPYFNGWDRNNTAATGGVSLHHPAGDIQKISTYTGTLVSSTWGSVPNTHWRVTWSATVTDHGVTEGGSSGSPLFNNSGRIVGDLTGGGSYCSTPTQPDLYGKFSYSWDQNGSTAAERLKDWLDPDNTGITTLDGAYCGASPNVSANFTANTTTIPVGGTVDFTDLSTGSPTSWSWTFNGGSPASSTTQHPAGIQYNTAGTYTVALTASNGTSTDTETKVNYIIVGDPPPSADFVANVTSIPVGGSVNFTDLTAGAPTSWSWTFSGGTPGTSTDQNPSGIVYNTAGAYTVSLTATNGNGSDTETKTNYIIVGGTSPGDNICDTMNYPLPGTEVLYSVIYQNSVYGYVSGNNGYSDKAKANFFVPASPYIKLAGAYIKFGKAKRRSGTSDPVVFAVWDNSGSGGSPGTNILASDTLTMGSIVSDVNGHNMTYIEFNPPVNISSPFYLGVYLPNIGGDTLALLTNKNGETYPGTAWEQWQGGTWYPYSDAMSWGYHLSHAIFPVMCKQDFGTDETYLPGDVLIYPNPASDRLTIDFGAVVPASCSIEVHDILGQLCIRLEKAEPVQNQISLSLEHLSPGMYIVNIATDERKISRKFSLSR